MPCHELKAYKYFFKTSPAPKLNKSILLIQIKRACNYAQNINRFKVKNIEQWINTKSSKKHLQTLHFY